MERPAPDILQRGATLLKYGELAAEPLLDVIAAARRDLFRVHRAAWRWRRRLSSFASADLRGSSFFLPRSVLSRHFVTCVSGGDARDARPSPYGFRRARERSTPHFPSAAQLRLGRLSQSTMLMLPDLLQMPPAFLYRSSRRIFPKELTQAVAVPRRDVFVAKGLLLLQELALSVFLPHNGTSSYG